MTDPTDRYVLEIGTGTVAHIVDTDVGHPDSDSPADALSEILTAPAGEKMCSRGSRVYGSPRLSFPTFVEEHDIDKSGFDGDAPEEICSYGWSNTIEAIDRENNRAGTGVDARIGTVGYRLRWK